jgi:hypothetical protein
MKTIVLTVIMLAGILQVKAQQTPLQLNKKADTAYWKLLKIQPHTGPGSIITLGNNAPVLAEINNGRMPIAKLRNTDLKMPVTQTDRTAYNMPVAGMNKPRVYYMKRATDTAKRVTINP